MTPFHPAPTPIPDANAIREFVVVRTREVGGVKCVSYYSVDPAGATKWSTRDNALACNEDRAISVCHRAALMNRSLKIRYTIEPRVPTSVIAHGLDWHMSVNPTNAPGSRVYWRAEAGEMQTPMRTGVPGHEWLIILVPHQPHDNERVMWGATLYFSGTWHRDGNNSPEIDRYYDTAAEAMEAAARVLSKLAPHLIPSDPRPEPEESVRDCIVVRTVVTDFAVCEVSFLADFAALDCPVFRPERESAVPFDAVTALDYVKDFNRRHAADRAVRCHVERVRDGSLVQRVKAPARRGMLCPTCGHAVDHPDNCAANHGRPGAYKTCSDWIPADPHDPAAADRSLIAEAIAANDEMDSRELIACIRALRLSPGLRAIALERLRQVEVKGYTPAHDARHGPRELFRAAGLDILGVAAESAAAAVAQPEPVVLSGHSTANGEVFIRVGTLERHVLVRSSDAEISRLDIRIGDTVALTIGDGGEFSIEAVDVAKRPPFARPMGKLEC